MSYLDELEARERVFKVNHKKGNVETVYLVSALSTRDAKKKVLAELGHDVERWTIYHCLKQEDATMSASPWRPDPPYRLYAIDASTGAMS